MQKIKENKKLLLVILLLLVGIGVTLAYFFNRNTFANLFISRDAPIIITEEDFESPSDWVPGTTTKKVLDIINENDYPVGIRVKFEESWEDSNGNSLPLYQCLNMTEETCSEEDWTMLEDKLYGNYCVNNKVCDNAINVSIINYSNMNKWKLGDDGYYYYDGSLASNKTAESPIKSVTFNENVEGDITCTTDTSGVTSCSSSGNSYDGGKYKLKIITEMIDYDNYDVIWGDVTYPYLYDKVSASNTSILYSESDSSTYNYEVYFETSVASDNVKFANHCFQIVGTTKTGGVKLLYNGEYDETKKCGTDRGSHVGYSTNYQSREDLSSNYYYGTDYTYDSTNKLFSLSGTLSQTTYNGTNIDDIRGKYTCKSTNSAGTCLTLYLIESQYYNGEIYQEVTSDLNQTTANVLPLTNTSSYHQFGTNLYNRYVLSYAYVGYMYNKIYEPIPLNGLIYKNITNKASDSFIYDVNLGKYILTGTIREIRTNEYRSTLNEAGKPLYLCLGPTTTCDELYLLMNTEEYYLVGDTLGNYDFETVKDSSGTEIIPFISTMLYGTSTENVNKKDSTIKLGVDKWYEHYMKTYTNKLEDIHMCNDRTVINQKFGLESYSLYFSASKFSNLKYLNCRNITDDFSTRNSKAKLVYPVAMLTSPEYYYMTNEHKSYPIYSTSYKWWLASPDTYWLSQYGISFVSNNGKLNYGSSSEYPKNSLGVRPVISLKPNTVVASGSGTTTDPFVIE